MRKLIAQNIIFTGKISVGKEFYYVAYLIIWFINPKCPSLNYTNISFSSIPEISVSLHICYVNLPCHKDMTHLCLFFGFVLICIGIGNVVNCTY